MGLGLLHGGEGGELTSVSLEDTSGIFAAQNDFPRSIAL